MDRQSEKTCETISKVLHVQRTFGLLVTDNYMQKNSMIHNMLYNKKYAFDVTNDMIMI